MPMPARSTVRGLPAASSTITSWPVAGPALMGLKVTLIMQEKFGNRVVPQLFVCANVPDVLMDAMVNCPLPKLLKVTCDEPLTEFTSVVGSTSELALKSATGITPTPPNDRMCGLPGESSLTATCPILPPTPVGAKVTVTVHACPVGKTDTQLFVCANSDETVMELMLRGVDPELVR